MTRSCRAAKVSLGIAYYRRFYPVIDRIKELLARAEAMLRRTRKTEQEVYEFGDCRLDIPARRFTRGDKEIKLSPKEFRLLELFVKRPGRALTRDAVRP